MTQVARIRDEAPHRVEAEQAVLGCLLLDGTRVGAAVRAGGEALFFDPLHAGIFRVVATKDQAGDLVSPVTVNRPNLGRLKPHRNAKMVAATARKAASIRPPVIWASPASNFNAPPRSRPYRRKRRRRGGRPRPRRRSCWRRPRMQKVSQSRNDPSGGVGLFPMNC